MRILWVIILKQFINHIIFIVSTFTSAIILGGAGYPTIEKNIAAFNDIAILGFLGTNAVHSTQAYHNDGLLAFFLLNVGIF